MIDPDVVRQLASFNAEGSVVTSCYLNVDGRENLRTADVLKRFDELIRSHNLNDTDEPSVADDLARIKAHIRAGFDRKGVRGLALFSSTPKEFWQVVSLPIPVESRLIVNPVPAIGPLESVIQELEPIGVLLADRQRSHFFVYSLGTLTDHAERFEELPRGYDTKDQSARGDTQAHVDELVMQHYRSVAKGAFEFFNERNVGRVALGGAPEAANEIEKMLHPYLKERLAPTLSIAATATRAEVRAAMLETQNTMERAHEAVVVEKLRDAVGTGQRGVAGLADTLDAVSRGRVQTLVVSSGYEASGWRCPTSGTLAAIGPHCPSCGAEMSRVDNVVEHAVHETFAQAGRVEVCVGNADLDVLGRIGAILRY